METPEQFEIWLKLVVTTQKQRQWSLSDFFFGDFEQISYITLMCSLLLDMFNFEANLIDFH